MASLLVLPLTSALQGGTHVSVHCVHVALSESQELTLDIPIFGSFSFFFLNILKILLKYS